MNCKINRNAAKVLKQMLESEEAAVSYTKHSRLLYLLC